MICTRDVRNKKYCHMPLAKQGSRVDSNLAAQFGRLGSALLNNSQFAIIIIIIILVFHQKEIHKSF